MICKIKYEYSEKIHKIIFIKMVKITNSHSKVSFFGKKRIKDIFFAIGSSLNVLFLDTHKNSF